MHQPVSRRTMLAAGTAGGLALGLGRPHVAQALDGRPIREPHKVPEAVGTGGAVSSVDPYASDIGIQVLKAGGNAADAAIAMAAALGVTEPFSSGLGGGGFFVFYDARSGRTRTINGRETAPASYTSREFADHNGEALDFDTVVNSGKSIGVPGTLATWELAAHRFGTRRLAELLEPAEDLARRGFVVDDYYRSHTESNAERFRMFPETVAVYLPGGKVPKVGDIMRNRDLADTYRLIARRGTREFYHGSIGRAIVEESRRPTTARGVSVLRGEMRMRDIEGYRPTVERPTRSRYRGLDVHGMGIPGSGGIGVSQILNLMAAYSERTKRRVSDLPEVDYLHWFSEASATAFADRNRYVGDVRGVPIRELLSMRFARERAMLFDPDQAMERPVPFGYPDGDYDRPPKTGLRQGQPHQGQSTTHLNATDRWGNVASYTLTIEQTGGSGITVPGHGFLLNNELTDFDFVPLTKGVPDPNLPGPGKRPRSSMSPTIVFDRGRPVLTAGTPGGSRIITTVAQILLGYLDRDLDLVDAIAAPRLSSRNGVEDADLGLKDTPTGAALAAKGHDLAAQRWISNASGIAFEKGRMVAAAETERGDGGSARVVRQR
ncbi:gamma-glutamyltransferase [Demetria terragena]|uniref:gamma-glutamyltransferase n=1 Tax=Demetria terragena TaxID=63959 RepID=UPI00037BBAE4|nr:gamma-glutamyltransferase [Demetria terragena]